MELKSYQRDVLNDIDSYLSCLEEYDSPASAFKAYWERKGFVVGFGGRQPYRTIQGTAPTVCVKVPTAGGKTFIACSALKALFERLDMSPHVVVWLVPSEAILSQTLKNLRDPSHPYRIRINQDFSHRVAVLSKAEALEGCGFTPATVGGQLTILVMSYQSLRTSNKEGRKAYAENSQLAGFVTTKGAHPVEGADATALVQALANTRPVVVVDESHNAGSALSKRMLEDLNPRFVLELTATPKKNSNIISYVDAAQLKREDMVKLPVVVFNRHDWKQVVLDAISLRAALERRAQQEENQTGRYVRPIALLQAEPRDRADSQTHERIRKLLIDAEIPANQIAVKTNGRNELANVDLMSRDCPVRFVITVNALREGWDCPFAYVLASIANRSSAVDVEQIVGRVLRQPGAARFQASELNMSYVLASSADFKATLENVVVGLNRAGFSALDYRVAEYDGGTACDASPLAASSTVPEPAPTLDELIQMEQDNVAQAVRAELQQSQTAEDAVSAAMLSEARSAQESYNKSVEGDTSVYGDGAADQEGNMSAYPLCIEFQDAPNSLLVPQFCMEWQGEELFSAGEPLPLQPQMLDDNLDLRQAPARRLNFMAYDDVRMVDTNDAGEAKISQVQTAEQRAIASQLSRMDLEGVRRQACAFLVNQIERSRSFGQSLVHADVVAYVDRLVDVCGEELLDCYRITQGRCRDVVLREVRSYVDWCRKREFDRLRELGNITCIPRHRIAPNNVVARAESNIPRSLYRGEDARMNNFEWRMAETLGNATSVRWWHRIRERGNLGREFCINGNFAHYPDFMARTCSGLLLLVETKGDDRDNSDSAQKLELGRTWQHAAGSEYRYYMVYESNTSGIEGAVSFDEFRTLLEQLA